MSATPQHSVTEQAKGPTIDLGYLALDAIRKSYVSAFGPLDPNIMTNDIDWHIHEIIKEAARAQPLASTAASEQQAGADELPPLPAQHDELRARWKCEDCNGTGEIGELMDQGYFQPPERARCSTCDGAGQVPIIAYTDDQMHDYARVALTRRATTADVQCLLDEIKQYREIFKVAAIGATTVASEQQGDTATTLLAEMVKMMDDNDEHGAGSDWHTRATALLTTSNGSAA